MEPISHPPRESECTPPISCGGSPPRWQRIPSLAIGLSALLGAFAFLPDIWPNPRLAWTFAGVSAFLLTWTAWLWARARQRAGPGAFRVEFIPLIRAHYIQASVQICLYTYWGWYFRDVYSEVPLIVAQLLFFYVFDGLLSWSRGRSWRIGCGPLPIILSTNVFLWFRADWFAFQFLLVATAALGKEFIKWERNGKRTHIFNPSAFGLALFALVLLATDTTRFTWAGRIADSFAEPTHIYVVVFLLGLVVQYFFSVTLMTFSAAATLCVLGLTYTWITGTYHFVNSNIPAPVFLGLHLLMTDPSTSPRTNAGRVIFGAMYGLTTFILFGILAYFDLHTVYDKLLPIPLLNLSVKWIDRLAVRGPFGAFERWEAKFQPRKLNLAHMGTWVALFCAMLGTGFVEAPHEGNTYEFWVKAVAEGRPNASKGLVDFVKSQARNGNARAWNELGVMYLEGKLVPKDVALGIRYFGKATKLGDVSGSVNLVTQYLSAKAARSDPIVEQAFDQIEAACAQGVDAPIYYLVGFAYETGRGRPLDRARAREYYEQGCQRGSQSACQALPRVGGQAPSGAPSPR